ncbi:protein CHUP1, chloroplastic isoform X2 [Carica papaya]|uniref:protein CHUP1, chloroplastic isoform X2 n=1 Tax=Carica papaya TaxID=3649 RepID=UPI000B8CDE32|nr:protein CHUP1, chloroplastic isoform X2 [Carica papaya]
MHMQLCLQRLEIQSLVISSRHAYPKIREIDPDPDMISIPQEEEQEEQTEAPTSGSIPHTPPLPFPSSSSLPNCVSSLTPKPISSPTTMSHTTSKPRHPPKPKPASSSRLPTRPRTNPPGQDPQKSTNFSHPTPRKNHQSHQEKLQFSEVLVKDLQSQLLALKADLDKAQTLNAQLQSQNNKLSQDLAAAEAKIAALTASHKEEAVAEYQSPNFKDIQKLIATKLVSAMGRKVTNREPKIAKTPSPCPIPQLAKAERRALPCPSLPPLPPAPPPPPPIRFPARTPPTQKVSPLEHLHGISIKQQVNRDPPLTGSQNKPTVISAHSSIVGEIQNRSAHLLAIRADIETKGEFINGLIQKVLAAAYNDIEDVLKFVDWLDIELACLADERAVLKHFKWPERKADALREAAVEYRELKMLEMKIYSYNDDPNIPCESTLKKMASSLDQSERSTQRLIKLRSSVVRFYEDYKIPTDWMLDSGIMSKIKQAWVKLAKTYMKRVRVELEVARNLDRESTQEALLLQVVHFAYRAHQFGGGLDSKTLCCFEEIKQHVAGHSRRSQELVAGIPSS